MRNILLPPGFKDELFEQSSTEHKYKNKIIRIFQKNGYELIKTPLIEYADKYNKNPDRVASIVFVSTLLSLFTIPVILYFLMK